MQRRKIKTKRKREYDGEECRKPQTKHIFDLWKYMRRRIHIAFAIVRVNKGRVAISIGEPSWDQEISGWNED